ncbi:glucosyl-3-phosphoglycerate synthase [bacterium BMS3Abin09]|nr:glucosyl-3-phosphoglycerate synthase [bacterium BMS3Abin09]GBE41261.1 glucosyl-3-phosphoglycerate synthase [bacterium BMS3Bbin09]HDH33898.1 glycosyl transferase [Nitrospirota bacterium]HDO67200.1 glycosyl transferase [Nitrospirota bacterium]HEW81374.1 glycosyl transferase [Nitrospirota bacterium]
MADFHQSGAIATFHKLGKTDLEKIEEELFWYSKERPIALVLPSLYSELEGEALKGIIKKLKDITYLKEVIVTLGQCTRKEFDKARKFFSVLPQETRLIWNNGKRVSDVYKKIHAAGLSLGDAGKGQSAWMAYGYILAQRDIRVIALHDCDIFTYNRELLARLCYPVTNPNLDYEFCKGYYSRVTDRMHGRATRLLITPLLRSLIIILGDIPLLKFLDSFRYPLAGEFAMNVDLARINKIPGDWGLEVGVLAEVYRNCAVRRVCQVDIAENYEHKHQILSSDDVSKGLLKMCIDISKSIFRTLGSEGMIFSDGLFKTLLATYVKTAQDMLKRYEDDAAVNGLIFDRHEESQAVETFTQGIRIASETIAEDPLGVPLISSWDRVTSALPNIQDLVKSAVDKDNK